MIINYIKSGWRSLLKRRSSNLVNIFGLAAGMCAGVLIALFVKDELSFDQHFTNKDRIYRITTQYFNNGDEDQSAQTQGAVASMLVAQVPEVEYATRVMARDEAFLFAEESVFKEDILYTDASFLKVFKLDLIAGAPEECLKNPSSLIISETMAATLFGAEWREKDVLGKSLSIDNRIPMIVTGVFGDLPRQTHFTTRIFASIPSGFESWMSDDAAGVYTYALLRDRADPESFRRKLAKIKSAGHQSYEQENTTLEAQALTEIYFSSGLKDENSVTGNLKNLYALVLGGLVLFLVTVLNCANLQTASSLGRVREVGIRKAIGAHSRQVRNQFLVEALSIAIVSALLALISAILLLPLIATLTRKPFVFSDLLSGQIFMLTGVMILATVILAGVYPSFFLSRAKAIHALKGGKVRGSGVGDWRKGLVMFQFAISGIAIMLSIVAWKQVSLINNKPLGFEKENTMTLANPYMLGSPENINMLKTELQTVPGIKHVSVTGYTPSQHRWGSHMMTFPGNDGQSAYRQMANWIIIDESFIETMGLALIAGRNFVADRAADKDAVIINAKAASAFGLRSNGGNAIGSELSVETGHGTGAERYTVIGIVEDFNFGSLHEAIEPMVMKAGLHRFEMVVRLMPEYSRAEVVRKAEAVWKRHLPRIPFEYLFIEDRFNELHKSDTDAGRMFLIICVVTIVISAMGLFSVVTYAIVNRTKEIGIRKVLGASGASVAFLIANDFFIMIIVSYVLAMPIAALVTKRWLSDFAYRVEVSWSVYAISAVLLGFLTVATLGVQTVKAALMNPVDSLRHE